MIRVKVVLVQIFLACTMAQGQDVLLSNIIEHITNYNPSLLSVSTHQYSVGLNYRQALNLTSAGGAVSSMRVSPNRISSFYAQYATDITPTDRITFEGRILDDNPVSSLISRTDITISFSYSKLVGDSRGNNQRLSIGTSLGYDLVRLTNAEFWFGSQYDIMNERVDLGIPSGEVAINQLRNRSGIDLSVGLSWQNNISNFGSYYVGLSAFHLNSYNQAVYQGSVLPIKRRYTAILGLRKKMNNKISWINSLLYNSQDVFRSIGYRTTIYYRLDPHDYSSVLLGLMPIVQDGINGVGGTSINVFTGYRSNNYSLNLSYDLGLGSITQFTDSRGTLELGFNYFLNSTNSEEYLSGLY